MRNFILDTNILIAYLKANPLFTKVSEDNNLNDEDAFIMISSISKGELLSLAMQNNWGERRVNILNKLLSEVVIIDVAGNDDNLLNAYAEIDAFSLQRHPTKKLSGSAKPMGKNDMWIAATAFATNATLLTADGKFMHLDKEFINIKFYHPKTV
ncbi:MAG: type II toxin-antitoxin system VapC family toxin [Cytophagales bacterium]|jgi:tRNA(fMet)-specific endonuclease VapC|nr:type II toxin-antitoxin system VapC family toxin [Cytophagales bacterium]MCA6435536.1 type II toxin-antitoxin system VapC family toxin [Bacteroidota bacterium]MCA6492886.1 type II toxin-antitoxin system VapC family toxin [Chitinophagaceae bacterium]MCA6413671.1 type II toxin-antitoxin system VapC family toxin [Cytophagales bacterium]MCA6415118.1 type II toxin-antitoxin system VapC family toxin [Cytophagales bacterium]